MVHRIHSLKKTALSLFLLASSLAYPRIQIDNESVGVQAEWGKPGVILMHTPDSEMFPGALHANAALFQDPLDTHAAAAEHKAYIKKLEETGATVVRIEDVLLQDTLDEQGNKVEGPALEELRTFAEKSLTYSYPDEWTTQEKQEQQDYKKETLEKLHPHDLLRIILEKPTVELEKSSEDNTQFIAKNYKLEPMANTHFLRDQQITTDKGVVLGNMNSTQRNLEVDLMAFVFKKIGVTPIYRVTGEGRLEGGDFIPAGDFALIGQGLRTNAEGIQQLFENKVFGYKEVAVVKDPFRHQDQMHLDTYFNVAGPKTAVVDTIRREKGTITRDDITRPIRPTVDIYNKNDDNSYTKVQEDVDFFDYIENQKGFTIKDLDDSEQLTYGCNFLCVGENEIIGVTNVSNEYEQKLSDAGISVTTTEFGNITKSYGGPHCTTQVINRS